MGGNLEGRLRYRHRAIRQYGPYINKLVADLGSHRIASIREHQLIKNQQEYSGKSSSAATKHRMILKQVFSKAHANRVLILDPSLSLPLPATAPRKERRALERFEVDLILNNWHHHHAGRWAMIMLLCGLHRGEMMALDWSSIDMNARTLTVEQSAVVRGNSVRIKKGAKTNAGVRTLPLCGVLFQMLEQTPEEAQKGAVCRTHKGKPLTPSAIDRGWTTFINILNRAANGQPLIQQGRRTDKETEPEPEPEIVVDFYPHDLRHTFATGFFEAGVDIKSAQYYLGHADASMTMNLYTHLTEERKNASRATLTDYLDDWLDPPEQDTVE